jgi:hypothetical protein
MVGVKYAVSRLALRTNSFQSHPSKSDGSSSLGFTGGDVAAQSTFAAAKLLREPT